MKKFLTAFNVLSRLVGVMVIALTLCVSPVHAQEEESQQETTGLFSPAEPPSDEAVQAAAEDPSVLRYRFVNVDLAQLNPVLDPETADTPVTFNLFPDANFSVVFTQIEPTVSDGVLISGSILEDSFSSVSIAVVQGVLSGRVQTTDAIYTIHYTANGIYIISQTESGGMPGEAPELEIPLTYIDTVHALVGDDTGEQLDILVVYTTNARIQAGGTAAIQADIVEGVAYTNTAYENSEINTNLAIVHVEEIPGYSETDDWGNMLEELTYTVSDGEEYSELDYVQSLRDTYQADLVTMIIYDVDYQYCGIGWVLNRNFSPVGEFSFSDYAFSIVEYRCASERTIAHETGHNLGAVHDRGQFSDYGVDYEGVYDYSFGFHVMSDGGSCYYYTIMAYQYGVIDGRNYKCNMDIQFYSNPNVGIGDWPYGVAAGQANSADVSQTINNTRVTAAQWRDGPPPNAPFNLSITRYTTNTLTLTWSAPTDSFVLEYLVERFIDGVWTQVGAASSPSLTYSQYGLVCTQNYTYRIRARSGDGISSYTDPVSATACLLAVPTIISYTSPGRRSAINLNWRDPNSFETGYIIERSLQGENVWTEIAILPANTRTFTNSSDIECGTAYDYRVRAYWGSEYSPYSSIVHTATLICSPVEPNNFFGVGSSQSRIDLSWVDSSDDPQNQESGFNLERNDGTGNYFLMETVPGESTFFVDTGLSCGMNYNYRINSTNDGGTSNWVYTTTSTNSCSTPAIPNDLIVRALSQYEIQILWSDGDDETAYFIERSVDGLIWVQIAELPTDSAGYIDSQLTPETQYYYRVRSANSYSAEPYQYTEPASATTYTLGLYVPIVQTP